MSSVAASSQTDGVTSDQPMLNIGQATSTESYSNKGEASSRRRRYIWGVFVVLAVIALLALAVGAIILLIRSSNVEAIYKPDTSVMVGKPVKEEQKQEKPQEYKFEFVANGEKSKEEVIINVKENYTELFAQDVTVFNHFKKRISLHRVEISPGVRVCLVKLINKEVRPQELEDALSEITDIHVNTSELYVIDSAPVSDAIKDDMTVHQFCHNSKIYSLKLFDLFGPDVGMTMEELLEQIAQDSYNRGRYRRQMTSNPLDVHNGAPYHCGGPIGSNVQLPAKEYTCTKKTSYCYKSLVSDRCEECYHGHNLRTRGCWCPISAIQTCIRITYKPETRFCCGVNDPPCVQSECDTWRVPFVPVPVITVKIVSN